MTKWVTFTRAEQARPGVKMRPVPTMPKPGRPKAYTVLRRESRPYHGHIIIFTDGGHIKVADAKRSWLVEVEDA